MLKLMIRADGWEKINKKLKHVLQLKIPRDVAKGQARKGLG